jgi:hypothetical protein
MPGMNSTARLNQLAPKSPSALRNAHLARLSAKAWPMAENTSDARPNWTAGAEMRELPPLLGCAKLNSGTPQMR